MSEANGLLTRLRADAPPFGMEEYDPTYDVRQEAANEIVRLWLLVEAAYREGFGDSHPAGPGVDRCWKQSNAIDALIVG